MKVNIFQLIEGARSAKGLTVIIDVFRAFSTACYAIHSGVEKIIPVGEIQKAYSIREKIPHSILVGERNEQKPEGFDFGNSPTQIIKAGSLFGKTMIHTTSSGTQGIVHAKNADEVISGSFVNAGAIIRYIKSKNPDFISLVCMGYACQYPTQEDTFCAEYIKNKLEGRATDFPGMVKILKSGDGARFFDPDKQSWSPESDFYHCLDINRFNFVLKVEKDGSLHYLRKIDI